MGLVQENIIADPVGRTILKIDGEKGKTTIFFFLSTLLS